MIWKTSYSIINTGPLFKFAVFAGFFGTLCGLLLILGGKSESSYMLVTWLVLTGGCSLKYLHNFLFNDWTDIEVRARQTTPHHHITSPWRKRYLIPGLHLDCLSPVVPRCARNNLFLLQTVLVKFWSSSRLILFKNKCCKYFKTRKRNSRKIRKAEKVQFLERADQWSPVQTTCSGQWVQVSTVLRLLHHSSVVRILLKQILYLHREFWITHQTHELQYQLHHQNDGAEPL